MKTPLHRDTRLDELDAEQFERMLASKPWAIYQARLALMWDQAATRCQKENNDVELRRAQGAAVALEAVFGVPKTILHELKGQGSAKSPRTAE